MMVWSFPTKWNGGGLERVMLGAVEACGCAGTDGEGGGVEM
jgi:hypothetical protein